MGTAFADEACVAPAIFMTDENGAILSWGDGARQLYGWTAAEAVGQPVSFCYVEADIRADRPAAERRAAAQQDQMRSAQRRRKDGAVIAVRSRIAVQRGADGEPQAYVYVDEPVSTAATIRTDRLAALLDALPEAACVVSRAGVLLANPPALALLGVTSVEALPRPATALLRQLRLRSHDGQLLAAGQIPILRALRGTAAVQDLRFKQPGTGAHLQVRMSAAPLRIAPSLTAALVVCMDLTTIMQQQVILREQATLIDLSPDAILVRDAADRIVFWSKGAEALYGYSQAEALGRACHRLLRTTFPAPLRVLQAQLAQTGFWSGELTHCTRDGRTVTVLSRWLLTQDDRGARRVLETNTDITERKQAETALRDSEEQFRLLIEGATDFAILLLEPDGRLASWNPAAEAMMGYSEHEIIGQPISVLFAPEDRQTDRPVRELEQAAQEGHALDDRWHLRKDGRRFFATGSVGPLFQEDGTLRGFVKIMRDSTAQRLAEEESRYLAQHDPLTGLLNRSAFTNQLHQALANANRTGQPLAILLFDLDRFKLVNDTLGHHAGDLLLKEVAARLAGCTRETDIVARLGGDEFAIIQTHLAQPDSAALLAKKLVNELAKPYVIEGHEAHSGASVGISLYPADGYDSVELLKHADLAMYRAKQAGRHTWRFFTADLSAAVTARKTIEDHLRQALRQNALQLHYQPQISLNDWRLVGVEVLLRATLPALQSISIVDLIDIAEESGLIIPLGQWVLETACRALQRWRQTDLPAFYLSVNLTPRQLKDPRFLPMLRRILADAKLPPQSLELEITEQALADRSVAGSPLLAKIKDTGVRLSVDDFGLGPSALGLLRRLPVDAVKIDQSVIQHLPHRRGEVAVASAIINMAHALHITVIAEGIETSEQLAWLKGQCCGIGQGYLFSPPLTAEDLEDQLRHGQWSRMNPTP